jgi:micrococcal nuclease
MYEYRARVLAVHDGDTCTCDIDLGFSVWVRKCAIRLDGLDAPELPTTAGVDARDALMLLVLNRDVTLRTRKDRDDKYGRMLGTIILSDAAGPVNVNEQLIAHGFARPYDGGKRG